MRLVDQSQARIDTPVIVNFRAAEPNPRHEAIRKDIAHRLRQSCSHLSDEEFTALVEKMLKVQLAGERRFGTRNLATT
jgi:hypothetical protein